MNEDLLQESGLTESKNYDSESDCISFHDGRNRLFLRHVHSPYPPQDAKITVSGNLEPRSPLPVLSSHRRVDCSFKRGTVVMGFLRNFLKSGYRDGTASSTTSSFRNLTEEQLEAHMSIAQYGNFLLTDAIRPAYCPQIVPRAGYRHEWYVDQETRARIPVLMASVSREQLFDAFLSMLEPLGETVDVVLETSHDKNHGNHADFYREQIDMPVLQSILYDYENLLLDDGCCGIAVLNPGMPLEVQLDEHKLLFAYGKRNVRCEQALKTGGVPLIEDMRFITEAEHVHSSSEEFQEQFHELCGRLGMDR
jgi:hypothetical protein